MDKEELVSKMNDGRTASVLLNWMDPVFKEVSESLLASLKSNFRNGTYSELLLACHVAQLCALDDLKNKISSVAKGGEFAAEELSKPIEEYEDGN